MGCPPNLQRGRADRVMSKELLYLSEQLLESAMFWSSEWSIKGVERLQLKLSASPEGLRLPAPGEEWRYLGTFAG